MQDASGCNGATKMILGLTCREGWHAKKRETAHQQGDRVGPEHGCFRIIIQRPARDVDEKNPATSCIRQHDNKTINSMRQSAGQDRDSMPSRG
jgi:hypothetical protein